MNAWLTAATVLLVAGLGPCVALVACGRPVVRLIALNLASVVTVLAALALAQGYNRSSYVDVALVLAVLSPAGSLVFARLVVRR